ncbi:hypothetical protein P7C73_g5424, partial [Tremellales sp. Uapishka_1]
MALTDVVTFVGGMATFSQILIALPMALDLLGPPSFLLLSLIFTIHHSLYSTLRLFLKNTPLAPLISLLAFLSPFITPSLILLTLYYHLHPPTASPPTSLLPSPAHLLVNVLPYVYASILRWVSPLFILLEGISTLLVVQMFGRVGKGWADEEDKEEGIEWRSLGGLVVAALVYCAGLAGVVKTFPSSSTSSFPAFLLGTALTSVLFLSFIGFALRRTNVLETSLVFVYVVYSAWLSGIEAAMEPHRFGTGWLTSDWAVAKSVSETSVISLAERAVRGLVDNVWGVSSTLPPHVLLSLIYRILVLHLAAKIVPIIRKSSTGWDDGMSASDNQVEPGFWDGRTLGEEPANMRVTTIVLSYRRAILICVYTHLLLLDAGSQTWWRWINIALFLSVWSLELLLDAEGEEGEAIARWKAE